MSQTMEKVLELALGLPGEERLHVAEALLASVPPAEQPFDAEWVAEARRRASKIDAGEGRLSTWPEVQDRRQRSAPAADRQLGD